MICTSLINTPAETQLTQTEPSTNRPACVNTSIGLWTLLDCLTDFYLQRISSAGGRCFQSSWLRGSIRLCEHFHWSLCIARLWWKNRRSRIRSCEQGLRVMVPEFFSSSRDANGILHFIRLHTANSVPLSVSYSTVFIQIVFLDRDASLLKHSLEFVVASLCM